MENLYLICLIPPTTIVEDIDEIRTFISEKYQVYESLKRPAHITLYEPVKLISKTQETSFFDALESAAFSPNFLQVLKNFNSFAQHTFYLEVDQNEAIINLQAQIKTALQPLKLLDKKDSRKFTPHLTLAFRDLKPTVYDSIVNEFKDKKFKREFMVNHFSIYKYMDRRWRPFKEIQFKNPAEKPKPLSLFG